MVPKNYEAEKKLILQNSKTVFVVENCDFATNCIKRSLLLKNIVI